MVKKHVTFAYPLVTFCTAPQILSTPGAFSKEVGSTSSASGGADSCLKPLPEKPVIASSPISKPAREENIINIYPKKEQVHSLAKPLASYLPDSESLAKLRRFTTSLKSTGNKNSKMVRIKAILGGDVRRFSLDEPSFVALHDQIRNAYSIPHIAIKYRDEEGDFVTLSSDAELVDALAIAQDNGGLLRLLLHPSPINIISPYTQVAQPRMGPLRHTYPLHHHRTPPPQRRTPPPPTPRHVPHASYPQAPPPPPNMYPGDIEDRTDRMLDSVLGAISWLLLGCILSNGIPLYNTLLLVTFVSLHRRLHIRPFIKRNVVSMIQARRLAPPPPHAPPHAPYPLRPHPPHTN